MSWFPPLLDLAVRTLVKDPKLCQPEHVHTLPSHLKDHIREILLKRRPLSPADLSALLHPRVREIDLEDQELTDDHLLVLSNFKIFRKINLNKVLKPDIKSHPAQRIKSRDVQPTTGALVQLITGQRYLETLFLRGMTGLSTEIFATLTTCKNLRHLDVARCPNIGDSVLNILRSCRNLESLSFAGTDITDLGLHYLANSESRDSLKELRIDRCTNVTDDGIQFLLEGLGCLEILIFSGCRQVTDQSRILLEQYLREHRRNVRQLSWTVY